MSQALDRTVTATERKHERTIWPICSDKPHPGSVQKQVLCSPNSCGNSMGNVSRLFKGTVSYSWLSEVLWPGFRHLPQLQPCHLFKSGSMAAPVCT